jgi:hypothetical protein
MHSVQKTADLDTAAGKLLETLGDFAPDLLYNY